MGESTAAYKVIIVVLGAAALALAVFAFSGRGGQGSAAETSTAVIGAARKLVDCRRSESDLRDEVARLRKQLAVVAGASAYQLDPEALALAAREQRGSGSPSQAAVVGIVRANKGPLQQCYERALKQNSALHGIALRLQLVFSIRPGGEVGDISIQPRVDARMQDCMVRAITRWRFPAFHGDPVQVESPVSLTPARSPHG